MLVARGALARQCYENNRKMISRVGVHFALEEGHHYHGHEGAGIHFYTLNRSHATRTIFDSFGIPRRSNARGPVSLSAV
jgi:methylenetetrahydrofolate reductase (NADPH)